MKRSTSLPLPSLDSSAERFMQALYKLAITERLRAAQTQFSALNDKDIATRF